MQERFEVDSQELQEQIQIDTTTVHTVSNPWDTFFISVYHLLRPELALLKSLYVCTYVML